MRTLLLAGGVLLALSASAAQATTVTDPTGGTFWTPTFNQANTDSNLDIASFSADFDAVADVFNLTATFAGSVVQNDTNFFVIGVDTGTGPSNFQSIGAGGVTFNTAFTISQAGAAVVGGENLHATVSGNGFTLVLPTHDLTSSGFQPQDFTFNLWTRVAGAGGTATIADFAPNNSMLTAVPEPASWALMIGGFGLAGAALRRQGAQKRRGVLA